MGKILIGLLCLLPWSCSFASGGIVSTSITGSTNAQLDALFDNANSTMDSATIQSRVDENNSYTQSDATWIWDGLNLTGSGLVSEIKTRNAKPGGDHTGSSTLSIQFTIDETMDYSLQGFWGLQNASRGDDSIGLTISDGGTVIAADSSTGTTGVASDSFSLSGTLGPGTYTMEIDATMLETINNGNAPPDATAGSESLAGWQIDSFTLSKSTVPEPTTLPIALMFLFATTRKAARTQHLTSGSLVSQRQPLPAFVAAVDALLDEIHPLHPVVHIGVSGFDCFKRFTSRSQAHVVVGAAIDVGECLQRKLQDVRQANDRRLVPRYLQKARWDRGCKSGVAGRCGERPFRWGSPAAKPLRPSCHRFRYSNRFPDRD